MNPLTKLRRSKSLTQKEMAKVIDVTYSHYTKLETGFVNPSFKLLKQVKKKFPELDINEFFE